MHWVGQESGQVKTLLLDSQVGHRAAISLVFPLAYYAIQHRHIWMAQDPHSFRFLLKVLFTALLENDVWKDGVCGCQYHSTGPLPNLLTQLPIIGLQEPHWCTSGCSMWACDVDL